MVDDPGPVVLPRTRRDPFLMLLGVVVLVHGYVFMFILLVSAVEVLRAGLSPWLPAGMVLAGGILLPMVAYIGRTFAIEAFEERLVVDVDGLRSTRGARVLMDLRFDEAIWVEVTLDGSGSVDHYRFGRGRWRMFHILLREYGAEEFAMLLPVVGAAVRKHGMRAGENLRKLGDG